MSSFTGGQLRLKVCAGCRGGGCACARLPHPTRVCVHGLWAACALILLHATHPCPPCVWGAPLRTHPSLPLTHAAHPLCALLGPHPPPPHTPQGEPIGGVKKKKKKPAAAPAGGEEGALVLAAAAAGGGAAAAGGSASASTLTKEQQEAAEAAAKEERRRALHGVPLAGKAEGEDRRTPAEKRFQVGCAPPPSPTPVCVVHWQRVCTNSCRCVCPTHRPVAPCWAHCFASALACMRVCMRVPWLDKVGGKLCGVVTSRCPKAHPWAPAHPHPPLCPFPLRSASCSWRRSG